MTDTSCFRAVEEDSFPADTSASGLPTEPDHMPTATAPAPAASGNARTRAGDGDAADPREAIIEHLPALRAFALSLSRDASLADDLVQETLLKAWTKYHLFTPGTNLRAWLFTILRNSLHSLRRKRKREVADPDGVMAGQLATKPDHDGRLALADLAAVFVKLPIEQREALLLVGAMGFSVEEAANTCGCAPGTIKSRAARGRRALAELLGLARGEGMDLTEAATMAVMSMQGQKAG